MHDNVEIFFFLAMTAVCLSGPLAIILKGRFTVRLIRDGGRWRIVIQTSRGGRA
jgi:hypothetical protein